MNAEATIGAEETRNAQVGYGRRLRRGRLHQEERRAERARRYAEIESACAEMGLAPPRQQTPRKCGACGTPWAKGELGPGTRLVVECKRCGMPNLIIGDL